jgi:hypothetical protein
MNRIVERVLRLQPLLKSPFAARFARVEAARIHEATDGWTASRNEDGSITLTPPKKRVDELETS